MFKSTLLTRLLALSASAAITFAVVGLIADYGLPGEDAQLFAQIAAPTVK